MTQQKPLDTLTWKKDDKYMIIEKTYHDTIYIDRKTAKETISIKQASNIPPTKRRHKQKQK